MSGTIALVGGAEWREGCTFDAALLQAAGADEVLVLPTAAAYEHPERVVEAAGKHFTGLGASVRGLMVLRRADADDAANADAVRHARFVYLSGGSPMHLRSVLKASAVWEALLEMWQAGGVVAGSSAGAMVLTDPMVDTRGGAFTVGLGLVEQLAVIPHFDAWSEEKAHRTLALAPRGVPIVGIHEQTALIRGPEGDWRTTGLGTVDVYVDGRPADLAALSR
ncbi:MAG TPA: Type 1 glutamine amidotransferase-like domain-containing protein [Acidimicrobiales bacterium]|nr:Type 1 glutamine amidotransferase-like domain-containing protein [Acidimicrobiales bacterium]